MRHRVYSKRDWDLILALTNFKPSSLFELTETSKSDEIPAWVAGIEVPRGIAGASPLSGWSANHSGLLACRFAEYAIPRPLGNWANGALHGTCWN